MNPAPPRWPLQHYRRNGNSYPECWPCQHYQRQEKEGEHYHWCELSRQGFPDSGSTCRSYLYEPGSDRLEFRGDA